MIEGFEEVCSPGHSEPSSFGVLAQFHPQESSTDSQGERSFLLSKPVPFTSQIRCKTTVTLVELVRFAFLCSAELQIRKTNSSRFESNDANECSIHQQQCRRSESIEDHPQRFFSLLDPSTSPSPASLLSAQSNDWLLPRNEFHRRRGSSDTRRWGCVLVVSCHHWMSSDGLLRFSSDGCTGGSARLEGSAWTESTGHLSAFRKAWSGNHLSDLQLVHGDLHR